MRFVDGWLRCALTLNLTLMAPTVVLAARDAAAKPSAEVPPVQVQMRNVALHVDEDTVLAVNRLRGALVSTRRGEPPVFDDKNSFIVRIDSAEIAVTADSLSRLMNGHVLTDAGMPLRDVQIGIEGGQLTIKGKLRKGITVPFTLAATPSVDRGALRLHPTSVKALGIPVQKVMSWFHLQLDALVKVKGGRGLRVDGDDFVLEPAALVPPPRIEGQLQSVRVEQGRLTQVFGPGRLPPLSPPEPKGNYMYYRGGTLRFGKLTMTDADMQLIDPDPADPFDFFQEKYLAQLVAGYSKNTLARGLKVYMPDYHRVKSVGP
jgi:hypothetical protein